MRGPNQIMKYFDFEHLPLNLQQYSAPFCQLARFVAKELSDSDQRIIGLQKLLEAKDCFVRAALGDEDRIARHRDYRRELFADKQHAIWSSWMKWMFEQGKHTPHGDWIMTKDCVARWERQMDTDYDSLTEPEKESDRKVVDEFELTKI